MNITIMCSTSMLLAYKSASLSTDPSSDSNEFRGGESEHGKREQLNEIKRDSKFEGEGKTIKKMRTRGGDKKKTATKRSIETNTKKKKKESPETKDKQITIEICIGRAEMEWYSNQGYNSTYYIGTRHFFCVCGCIPLPNELKNTNKKHTKIVFKIDETYFVSDVLDCCLLLFAVISSTGDGEKNKESSCSFNDIDQFEIWRIICNKKKKQAREEETRI